MGPVPNRSEREGRAMRLYFITPDGERLAINTNKEEYCKGGDISDYHRFIKLDSPQDITIIESELEFCGWDYGNTWGDEVPRTEADALLDPFYRRPADLTGGDA